MVRGPKSTTAFVEFADIPTAIMVHSALQGAVLPSSDRGGIRVQYSKNPFGRREIGATPHIGLSSPATAVSGVSTSLADSNGLDNGHGMAGLVGSPRSMTAASLLSNVTGGGMAGQAANMVAPAGSFIGQAGLDTVLGTSEA